LRNSALSFSVSSSHIAFSFM